jgi:Putative adhesin
MNTTIGSAIEHQVGSTGIVAIRTTDADVTVTAVDGAVARLRAADGRDLGDHYRWRLADGSLTIEPRDRGIHGLQRLLGERTPDIVAEVPRHADLAVETVSGAVHVHGAHGSQRYRLISGAIEATGVAGSIVIDEVSGPIHLESVDRTAVRLRTVSGSVDIAGPVFDVLDVHTMSGFVDVRGRLEGAGPFAFDGVSGGVSLAVDGSVRVAGTTVSGSIATDLPHRMTGAPGRRTIEVGDGGPLVAFKTVSGNLRVVRRDAAATQDPPQADATEQPDISEAGPTADAGPVSDLGPASDHGPAADPREAARLDILRDLEAGRIDVTTATARLEELDGAGPTRPDPTSSGSVSTGGPGPDPWAVRYWDHRA